MNDTQTNIERIVMRRVHLIRLLALIVSTATLFSLTLVAALWGIGREVWVAHIFTNMPPPSDIVSFSHFWLAAFSQTRLVVQILTLLTLVSLIYLVREIARLVARTFPSVFAREKPMERGNE